MIKVRLKHYSTDRRAVYSVLLDNGIQVHKTNDWGDVTICTFEDQAELKCVLQQLNKTVYGGVQILSQREIITLKDILTWWRD